MHVESVNLHRSFVRFCALCAIYVDWGEPREEFRRDSQEGPHGNVGVRELFWAELFVARMNFLCKERKWRNKATCVRLRSETSFFSDSKVAAA